jgi:GNAT superfamily N-acetyltransferase
MHIPDCPPALHPFLTFQPFEAEFFGGPVWRVNATADAGRLQQVADFLTGSNACFAHCRIDRGNDAAESELRRTGFIFVEELVTLELNLSALAAGRPPTGVEMAGPDAATEIGTLAARTFQHDRFHADGRISREISDALKGAWAHNNTAGRSDTTFVIRHGGRIGGFNSCLLRDGDAVIDLIGVGPEFQGKGLGGRLVDAALTHYAGKAAHMRVGTQRNNQASMQLYTSRGFQETGSGLTFHWLPQTRTAT